MVINKLKINRYGKLNDKEINLDSNINIIYGKNESGKSTILNFIINSLYGISKNKKGKDISDYDKYNPWLGEDFSGKIEYELDNKEQFEIYRDFKKKNPNIYNEKYEDISKQFNIDKNKGNEFFEEQTNINEETFLSTFAIIQKEVKIEKSAQNILIQKISNTISTGKHNTSFKKAIDKINKRQIEEIGTGRTREKPTNVIPKKIEEIEIKEKELEIIEKEREEKVYIKQEIEQENKYQIEKYNVLKELNLIENNKKIEEEKIKIKNDIIIDDENKIKNLHKKIENIKKEKNNLVNKKIKEEIKKINKKIIINLILFILINILQLIFVKNKLINIIFSLTTASVLIFYYFYKKNKIKNNNLFEKEKINNEINQLNNEINILEKNKNELNKEIEKNKNQLNLENNLEKEKIKNKYKNILEEIELNKLLNNEDLKNEIYNLEKNINDNKIKIETINIELKNIDLKLHEKSRLEENKVMLTQQLVNIKYLNTSIEIAKEVLTDAYDEMKNNINPQFIKQLSVNISEITNGKYNNILFNEEDGLIVELDNGRYIPAERLSIGTIEQIYLALRFAIMDEITDENMPIFLDEAFAFYDTERLKNTLEYISNKFKNRQIIIFTCTDREKDILEQMNVQYNYVSL